MLKDNKIIYAKCAKCGKAIHARREFLYVTNLCKRCNANNAIKNWPNARKYIGKSLRRTTEPY